MPDKSTVLRWLLRDEQSAFRDQYARAREAQADCDADEIIEIADDTTRDVTTIERDGKDVEVVNHEHIQRSRLRVDARKWRAAKMAPKKYGDKVALEHTGKDGKDLPVGQVTIIQLPDNGRG
jgi:hypothetical protein